MPRIHAGALALAGATAAVLAAPAHAQCPDGTPPPCAGQRPAAARRAPPPTAERGRRFLVLPFRNVSRASEHEWLVEGSTTMLNDALGRWQEIRVVPDDRLYPALRRAGITPGDVAAPPRVRRIAEETGGWTAVTGDIVATGGRVRVSARAYDVVTNRELVRATGEVAATADVRAAYDTIGVQLLRSAGLDSATLDLRAATTRSLDAYRAYLQGIAHRNRSEARRAQAAFREAVRLDSSFAVAWARLAEVTIDVSPEGLLDPASPAVGYAARAAALSGQLPPRQRRVVQALDGLFRGEITATRRTLEELIAADSDDIETLDLLSSVLAMDPILVPVPGGMRPRGSWNTAMVLAKRVLELDPARHGQYELLVSVYMAAGGLAPGIAVGRLRERTSLADMLRAPPDRVFIPFFRDTIELFPAESLAAIPRDSLTASRRRGRAAARAWVQRWLAVGATEAAAHRHASRIYELDGDYESALRALARAESLGVEQGYEQAPVRRMILQAKAGHLPEALRVADSLWSARYFDSTNVVLASKTEGLEWAFALYLLGGHPERNGTLFERVSGQLQGLGMAQARAEGVTFEVLIGASQPWLDRPVPAAFVAQVADTVLRHVNEVAATGAIARWLPVLLNRLVGASGAVARLAPRLIDAAQALADSGRGLTAFQLASNALLLDSTLDARVTDAAWYRSRAEALEAGRLAIQERFHAGTATVTEQQAAFEWRVDGEEPFAWFREDVPPGRVEYRWWIELDHGGRLVAAIVALSPQQPGAVPRTTPLAQVLNASAVRAVLTGERLGRDSTQFTPVPGAVVRTEIVPGGFRMIARDSSVLAWLRRERPAEARFRFFPCHHEPAPPHRERCMDERVPVTYP